MPEYLRCIEFPSRSSKSAVVVLQLLGIVLECQIDCPSVQKFVFGREASRFMPPSSDNNNGGIKTIGLEKLFLSRSLVQPLVDWDFFPPEDPANCYLREAVQKHVRRRAQKMQMNRESSWHSESTIACTTICTAQSDDTCLIDRERKTWNYLYLIYSISIDSLCKAARSFLSRVIERVKRLHDGSIEENIALSGVISNMVAEAAVADTDICSWINRMLILFLFHKEEPSSLYSAISWAWHEGMDR